MATAIPGKFAPVSKEDFCDLFVAESALDQFQGEISSMRMIGQIGNAMRRGQPGRKIPLLRIGPLAIKKFEKIEANPDAIDPNQTDDVLHMVDIPVECRLFLPRTHQDGVDADNAAACADHPDLLVADIAFDVVKPPRVGM